MPDNTAKQPSSQASPTIAEIMRDVQPMGDLSRFLIDDMTPEEEDEFFLSSRTPDVGPLGQSSSTR